MSPEATETRPIVLAVWIAFHGLEVAVRAVQMDRIDSSSVMMGKN
ncbi:hypothetical protein A3Q56_06915 [Intoshia linei]|uniref:Uncharacterized protein n=1 Tax=Intoshia linei TaxID=1819745 RepID=A0A177AU83_9BILA|nr:hypothetical protein A3Q56_06915 [Intoshia linei]